MYRLLTIRLVLAVAAFSHTTANVAFWNTANLQPVHGLFVKPSGDGTGDLYVAATEDNGVSQWVNDQPVNFLTDTQPQPSTIASEESVQKHAVVTNPAKYAYAIPIGTSNEKDVAYPFAVSNAQNNPAKSEGQSPCSEGVSATIPQYSPYQYFYPHLMPAFANALASTKDPGTEDVTSVLPQGSPAWPSAAYAYPVQYVMVNPNAWTQNLATTSSQSSPNDSS